MSNYSLTLSFFSIYAFPRSYLHIILPLDTPHLIPHIPSSNFSIFIVLFLSTISSFNFYSEPFTNYICCFLNNLTFLKVKTISRAGFEPTALTVLRLCHNQLDHPDS